MRARWIEEWGGELQIGERRSPHVAAGELLIEVEACGVGLTVLNCIRGDLGNDSAKLPRVPGHEIVGRVVACGPGSDPDWIGARVVAYFYLFCGRCPACLAAREPECRALAGYIGVDRDGGYAELVALPARNVLRISAEIEAADATTIPDAVATPVAVAARAGIRPMERVAVIAAGGGVGVHMVQVAKLARARVAGLEADEGKLAALEPELGVDAVASADFAAVALPAGWGGRADVIVDLLGSAQSLEWSLAALAVGGRLIVLTTFRDVSVPVSPRALVLGQGSVLGSRYASRRDVVFAAELVASGHIRPLVGQIAGWKDVEHLHERLEGGRILGRGALVWDA